MKLLHCHIENFGKLHEQDFDFQEGLNTFLHKNGWGKSTLASFLKVMFFGFEGERLRDDFLKERSRYRPWQGGVYGGSVTFEAKGKTYIATRIFGLKEKEDRFSLREKESNLESRDYSSNLGEELFSIDRASFERTVFLSQNDCETRVTDRIHGKLGNLTDLTEDVNQYEKADQRLHDLLNAMSPVRKTGSLYQMREEMEGLEVQIRKRDSRINEMIGLKEDISRVGARILSGKQELERTIHFQGQMVKFQALQLEVKNCKLDRDRLIISKEQMLVLENAQKKKTRGKILLALGLTLAGGLFLVMEPLVGILMGFTGLLLSFFFFYKMKKEEGLHGKEDHTRNIDSCIMELNAKISEAENALKAMEDRKISSGEPEKEIGVLQNQIEQDQGILYQMEEQLGALERILEDLDQKEEQLMELRDRFAKDLVKYERLKLTRSYLAQARAAFSMKYRNPVKESFQKYYDMITGGEGSRCHMDSTLSLTVEEQGEQRKTEYFSAGWRDLMGICLRMAFADTMYSQEKPFLIFDDPFLNLDDEKGRAGIEFLNRLSKDYQILYFTCHKGRT